MESNSIGWTLIYIYMKTQTNKSSNWGVELSEWHVGDHVEAVVNHRR